VYYGAATYARQSWVLTGAAARGRSISK